MKIFFIMLSIILSPLVLLCGIVSVVIIYGIINGISEAIDEIKNKEEK